MLDYPGIALVMVLAPPELIMPFAGFLAATSELTFVGVIIAGTVGSMIGSSLLYLLARWLGEARMRRFLRRYGRWVLLFERDFDRALRLFDRYDNSLVFFGRFIPTVRSVVSLPAGLLPMAFGRFLLLTGLAAGIWNIALAYAGLALGRNWPRVLDLFEIYEALVWLALALVLLVFLTRRVRYLLASA
jgi:membrane protein DedA with SNARE-associated domain